VLVEVSPQQKTQDQKTHDFLIKAMQVSGFITVETGKNIVDTTKYKDFIVLTAKNSDVTFPDIFKSISSLECISKSDIKEDDSGERLRKI
jgi:hypothetical protein